jgi:hypothetical protein
VELHNPTSSAVDLSSFVLHDSKGPSHTSAYEFPSPTSLPASSYLVVCCGQETTDTGATFSIGGDDTIALVDGEWNPVSTPPTLPGGGQYDISYSLVPGTGGTESSYNYTSTPTPGEANVISAVVVVDHLPALAAQNDLGTDFFAFNNDGTAPDTGMAPIVDLHVTMTDADLAALWDEQVSSSPFNRFFSF